jgi:hypothetical protein
LVMKSVTLQRAGYITHSEELKNVCKIVV